jgi:hypothetical protein
MRITISEILLAPWITGVITAAIHLRIFSILSDRELTVEQIAAECQAVSPCLRPLLDACVGLKLLEFENDRYCNSHFSLVHFVEGQRLYVGDFLKVVNAESLQWFQLPDLVRGKEKRMEELPYVRSDYETFVKAMDNIGNLGEAEALRDVIDLSGCKRMIDAGGKDTLAVTKEMIASRQGKERIDLREGDFLRDPLGEDVDVVLLSDVIYEESMARVVLRNAWNSLAQDGVLVIRGYYADPERSRPLFGALFAVKELVDAPQRKTMTISALEKNVREIGFRAIGVAPLTEFSFVLVGRK